MKRQKKNFNGQVSRRLPFTMQRAVRRKLLYLEEADDLQDLRSPPGNRLEMLKGDRAGQYRIRVNDQLRICFLWIDGKAEQVKIEAYHD